MCMVVSNDGGLHHTLGDQERNTTCGDGALSLLPTSCALSLFQPQANVSVYANLHTLHFVSSTTGAQVELAK